MVRIANVELQKKSRVVIALQQIYGIGNTLAHKICDTVGIQLSQKIHNLNEKELAGLRSVVDAQFTVEGDLRKEVAMNIKRKKDIRCYQGIRHERRLPVRGQNTKCNARTRKGRATAIAGKKHVAKK